MRDNSDKETDIDSNRRINRDNKTDVDRQTDRQTDRHRKIQNSNSLLTFPDTIFSYIWIGWSAKKGG